MAASAGYLDYVEELLGGLGAVRTRRMFGAAGVFLDGVMFALVDDDILYIKTDDAFVSDLKAMGSAPWTYTAKRDGITRDMGYWRLPESAADDPDEAVELARRSLRIARSKKTAGKAPARKK
ncbi:MAG: TfoX/Sxy family protein [Hyphomonadaceae bacterium]